jgi:hypothetical protein
VKSCRTSSNLFEVIFCLDFFLKKLATLRTKILLSNNDLADIELIRFSPYNHTAVGGRNSRGNSQKNEQTLRRSFVKKFFERGEGVQRQSDRLYVRPLTDFEKRRISRTVYSLIIAVTHF